MENWARKVNCTKVHQEAFDIIKKVLLTKPMLKPDYIDPFVLQCRELKRRPSSVLSKKKLPGKPKHSNLEKVMHALKWVKNPYGTQNSLLSNTYPTSLERFKDNISIQDGIQCYKSFWFNIIWWAGKQTLVADYVPLPEEHMNSIGWHEVLLWTNHWKSFRVGQTE